MSDPMKDLEAIGTFFALTASRGFTPPHFEMCRITLALAEGSFEKTQREFLAADLRALAEGKPVETDLAKAVDNRIQMLKLETEAATSMLLDVQQEAIASAKRVAELEAAQRHVCGLSGYNPMIDPPCPGCVARIR